MPKRFPALKFAFLEGGAGWASQLYNTIVADNMAAENADVRGSYDARSAYNLIGVIGTSGGLSRMMFEPKLGKSFGDGGSS